MCSRRVSTIDDNLRSVIAMGLILFSLFTHSDLPSLLHEDPTYRTHFYLATYQISSTMKYCDARRSSGQFRRRFRIYHLECVEQITITSERHNYTSCREIT